MKIQVVGDDGKNYISCDVDLKTKNWRNFYLVFWARKDEAKTYLAQVVMGKTGYRVVKERWYHRFFDKVNLPLVEGFYTDGERVEKL